MASRYICRGAAAVITFIGFSAFIQAQHTLIKKDGNQIDCQVLGSSGGMLRYTFDPGSGQDKTIACTELLALVDDRLIVHSDPCGVANALAAPDAKKNCASLIRKDNSVVKGSILGFMDDYIKIRTTTGEKNESLGGLVGQITSQEGVWFENEEFARKVIASPEVVLAINELSQCPDAATQPKAGYSPTKAKVKFDVGKKKPGLVKPGDKPPIDPKPPVNSAARGLLEVLDFDTFSLIAMAKVERLGGYISQIADKKLSMTIRDKAVSQGLELFEDPQVNIVGVSKLKKDGTSSVKARPVTQYLQTDLKYHPYEDVQISWADLNYASDFEQQPDGSYRAVISVQQRFTGKIDGVTTYSDVTNKNITITLRQYQKLTDTGFKKLWDVFLGDIGVTSTHPG